MDYESYRKHYYADPAPEARFAYAGILGMTLYYEQYEEAVAYYSRVLGPPAYVEGDDTRGWRFGDTWLTLLKSPSGNPQNAELTIVMQTPEEADRLHAAFLEAGGKGDPPTDSLMYVPIRYCFLTDPFGTNVLIYCPLPQTER